MKKFTSKLPKVSVKTQMLKFALIVFLLFIAGYSQSSGISQTFYVIAYFVTAFEYLCKGFAAILKRDFFNNEFLLFLISLLTLLIGIKHAAIVVNIYYYLYYIFQLVSNYRRENNFMKISANIEHVNVVDSLGSVTVLSPDQIKVGDLIMVNPGEYILTDGIVTEGFSTVNTFSVTSDVEPYEISINDRVMAGYINLRSPIIYKSKTDIHTTHFDSECTIAEKCSKNKSKNHSFINKYSGFFTLVFLLITFITLLISVFTDLNNEITVVLAVVSGMVSLSAIINHVLSDAAFTGIHKGIAFKSADDLIDMSGVTTAVLEFKEKVGEFVIDSVEVYDEFSEDNLKDIAACLYSKSSLPFAKVINEYAGECEMTSDISGYREIDHSGCFAYVDGRQVVSGTTEFMKKSKIHIPVTTDDFEGIHFAVEGTYIGNIHFESNNYYKLSKTISAIRCCGVENVLVFGIEDDEGAARLSDTFNVEYFSIAEDRMKIINEMKRNVPGKVAVFGWHDWLLEGVKTVYLGNKKFYSDDFDADIATSGSSASRVSDVINIAYHAKRTIYFSAIALFAFKIIVGLLALFNVASVYFAVLGEFILYVALAFISSFKFKKI